MRLVTNGCSFNKKKPVESVATEEREKQKNDSGKFDLAKNIELIKL